MTGKVATVFGGAFLFLLCPYLLIFLAKQAYTGLFKGTTLTHFGLRSGWIARLYGVFYLLMFPLYFFEVVTIALIFFNFGSLNILHILFNILPNYD